MLHAVIMAGGAGTRFWPESRAATPKQLLGLVDERSMIRTTVERLEGLVPAERVLIVTNRSLVSAIASDLPGLPPRAILGEPCKRDTAPCIGLAAIAVSRDDSNAVMAVMPADHVIRTEAQFRVAIGQAVDLVEQAPGRIVTIGILPTYPAESFGYIERGPRLAAQSSEGEAYQVKRFREKPNRETAQQYLDSGNFYWNSGIFIWRAATILEALRQHQPKMYAHLERIADAWNRADCDEVLEREFAAMPAVSIDYAVMEHAQDVAVIPAPFAWDDVGSWRALARLRGTDDHGNTIVGRHVGLDTRDSIVRTTSDHLVATLGMQNCIVVHTPDATLVANAQDEEAVRGLVKILQEKGWTEYL